MPIHLAFLRAINLGAKRKFPKDAVARSTESAGFTGVSTHLNTGNVRFTTTLRSRARIEAALETAYLTDRGFEVPTLTFTALEFAELAAAGQELEDSRQPLERHYVHLLKEELTPEVRATVEGLSSDDGDLVVTGRAVHALLGPGYTNGVVDPHRVQKFLGVTTARNFSVVSALGEKWC